MKKLMTTIVLFMFATLVVNAQFNSPLNPTPNRIPSPQISLSVFDEIMTALNNRECISIDVTSVSLKKRSGRVDQFTSFGIGRLSKENTTTLKADRIRTFFSNRNTFTGATTQEKVRIIKNGSSVKVEITQHDWRSSFMLQDVKIVKDRSGGYFITGNIYKNSKYTFYILSLKRIVCLI